MRCCARWGRCGLLAVVMGVVEAGTAAAADCPAGTVTIPIVLTKGMLDGSEKIPNDTVVVYGGSRLLWRLTNNAGQEVKLKFVKFYKEDDGGKSLDPIDFPGWWWFEKKGRTLDVNETKDLCVKVKDKAEYYGIVKYDINLEFGNDKEIPHDPRLDIKEPPPFDKGKGRGGVRP